MEASARRLGAYRATQSGSGPRLRADVDQPRRGPRASRLDKISDRQRNRQAPAATPDANHSGGGLRDARAGGDVVLIDAVAVQILTADDHRPPHQSAGAHRALAGGIL